MTIAPAVLAPYINDIAYAAEQPPAETPEAFLNQLEKAAYNLHTLARINGAEDLETAATYLADALQSTGSQRRSLTNHAVRHLAGVRDVVDEYRGMVGDVDDDEDDDLGEPISEADLR